MEKIKAAVIGYGNIGRYVIEALQVAPDFEIVGVVRRNAADVPAELDKYKVVSHLQDLEGVQVAILCNPICICFNRSLIQFFKHILLILIIRI